VLAKATLVHTYANIIIENTFGRELADLTDLQAEALAMAATFGASDWMAGRTSDMKLVAVRLEDDTPGTAATGDAPVTPNLTGDGDPGGSYVPPLVAINIQWKGTLKGKPGRGRCFLTGYPSTTQVGGFWTTDAQDPASAAASVIFDAYGPDGDASLVIINRKLGGVDLVPHTSNPITAFTIDNVVRRQGRREQGRGI
jgi:hypothetical protein